MKRLLCWILSLCLLLCLVPGAAAAERVTGTLERRAGYDLASVRCELADGSYFFASVEETAAGYAYAFDRPAGTYTVRPEYFSTTVWDGAVDISWYDASQTAFYLDTPAKLAGLAALVNGQVDAGTPDYRIKGDRSELVSTRVDDYLLVGAGGDNQYGTVHVGDAAHDFSDKTVYLTADLNMGGSSNWTPIGGLYPMDRANTERVIAAYFNGTLDGQGHRITNLFCDRYAEKGYAYSQGVGLIGHMGDLYDGEAAPETDPAVRNLSVSGSIYGRRMVGGIVGRTGSIPTGIYLENCANHASVKNTDSKGVGGIVGAGWSEGAIVNCYNTGSVTTGYACPAGGICGSNSGLDIYNCYNAGVIDSNGSQRGRAIGGHNNGSYTVSDCYYLEGCDDDPASNGWYSGTALSCVVSVTAMPKADMRSQKLVDALNCNGAAYAAVQGSYPVLAWEAERSPAAHTVRITQPEGGTVASDGGESVAFGTVLHLSNTPDIGWAFRTYTLNGETLTGPYATVTADAAVSGVFSRMTAGALYIENAPAFPITVKKDGTVMENGTARRVTDYPVADGDPLYEGDMLTATATLAEGAEPEDLSYVYNGKFRYYFTFQDAAQTEKSTDTGKFTVTSRIASASLRLRATAYTTHKVWTQLAETDWYTPSADSFTLTSARQLAGLAQLVKQGNSFAGKTVLLGADISLANDDKTFNRGVRWFDGIGSTQAPFAGTFDGNGCRITEMTAESTGSGAALFLAADGAVLKNIRVSGTAKANGSAAGIAAQAKNTQFLGCVNEAAVTSTGEKAGGIAALLDGASSLTGCTNLGAVTGTDGVGGLAGVVNDKESTLTGCVNRGAVTGNGAATGIGGVAGRIGGSLLRCANYGAVTGSGWYLGGVAGACMTEGASSLTDCYSAGEVRNAHTYASSGTGGLIGYGNDYRAENCFSYGAVSAAAGTAGGLIGRDSSRSTNVRENLYYRADSCGTAVGGKAEASGTAARTAAEFAALSFLRQLDKNGCFMLENGAYPELSASARCAHLETELRDARAATCTEAGYTGDTVCKACGTEITHGEVIPAAGHQYRNGACTVCGAKDPRWSGTERPWNDPFRDVRVSDWFYSGVKFAYQHGLFQGTAADMFSPDEPMTRAMLVTVLWRMDGKPSAAGGSSFTDVPRGQWYTEAVAWAAENGVVNGVGGGKFEPDGNVTREQIATILYRYAGLRGVPTGGRADLGSFPDGGAVSGWAYDALSWANAAGLIAGTREGGVDYLAPQQNATRAQVAVILMRYLGAA